MFCNPVHIAENRLLLVERINHKSELNVSYNHFLAWEPGRNKRRVLLSETYQNSDKGKKKQSHVQDRYKCISDEIFWSDESKPALNTHSEAWEAADTGCSIRSLSEHTDIHQIMY